MSGFAGEFTLLESLTRDADVHAHELGGGVRLLRGLLSPGECAALAGAVPPAAWVPVGVDGMRPGFDPATDPVGSWRATALSDSVAVALWQRIATLTPTHADTSWATDHEGASWRAVGVNPLLRFIRYTDGGRLIPHYDAPFAADERTRTLQSLVIYLGSTASGGRTRFLRDPQLALPFADRDHADWPREARPDEIRSHVEPEHGAGLLFPHRLLHDSEPVRGGAKLLLRTDIVYRRS